MACGGHHYVPPKDMLAELSEDNLQLVEHMRDVHCRCEEHGDVASASYLENWIDDAERRIWFLLEANREVEPADRLRRTDV